MVTTITKSLEIDAGHRLLKHESKCRNVHGHRYRFDIEVTAAHLDEVGRVIDFGCIKEIIGGWLDENWDHAFLAEAGDPIIKFLTMNSQKLDVLLVPPTAENLARLILEACIFHLPQEIKTVSVTCWETPSCKATVRRTQ